MADACSEDRRPIEIIIEGIPPVSWSIIKSVFDRYNFHYIDVQKDEFGESFAVGFCWSAREAMRSLERNGSIIAGHEGFPLSVHLAADFEFLHEVDLVDFDTQQLQLAGRYSTGSGEDQEILRVPSLLSGSIVPDGFVVTFLNVSNEASWVDLRALLFPYHAHFVDLDPPGTNKRMARVFFKNTEDATASLALNDVEFMGRTLQVSFGRKQPTVGGPHRTHHLQNEDCCAICPPIMKAEFLDRVLNSCVGGFIYAYDRDCKQVPVFVTHVESAEFFWGNVDVQDDDTKAEDKLFLENERSMNEMPEKRQLWSNVRRCAARFEGWLYRGYVVKRKDNECFVFFIDYGNACWIPSEEVIFLPSIFWILKPRCLPFYCSKSIQVATNMLINAVIKKPELKRYIPVELEDISIIKQL